MNCKAGPYVLNMSCVSGDAVKVHIHRYEDVGRWLQTLDHEGSSWEIVDGAGRKYEADEWGGRDEANP